MIHGIYGSSDVLRIIEQRGAWQRNRHHAVLSQALAHVIGRQFIILKGPSYNDFVPEIHILSE